MVCAASVAAVVTSGAAFSASRLTRNYTASLPLGVYWLRPGLPVTKGALVDFAIPPNARGLIADRYLPARFHLLKRVVALDGDVVCLAYGRVLDPGERLAHRIAALAGGVRVERHRPPSGNYWNEWLQRCERDYIRSLGRSSPERSR